MLTDRRSLLTEAVMNARLKAVSVAAALALFAWGCGHKDVLSPLSDSLSSTSNVASVAQKANVTAGGPQHAEGSLGPGALYSFAVPESWSGGLVLFVHGYTPAQAEVAIPPFPLRDFLLGQGFAVAMSSFSENGYAVAEGARQSHQLLGAFADRYGKPNCTLLLGVSLGGIIGLELTEKYPEEINGSLLVSGVTGGSRAEIG